MLVWATEFPLHPDTDLEDVIRVGKHWLAGSPHSNWHLDDFHEEEPLGEVVEYEAHGRILFVATLRKDDRGWAGLKETWTDENQYAWTTETVGRRTPDGVWVSVRVSCDRLQPWPKLPQAKKPYIVRMLLEELGHGVDAGIQVDDKPVCLREPDVPRALKIVLGDLDNRLPVVYVSAPTRDTDSLDVDKLARWLSGMAHVVVEPSRYFTFALSPHVGDANPYNGAVSVYWPRGDGRQTRLLPHWFDSHEELERATADEVQQALVHSRPTPELTWAFLREQISRDRIAELRDAGSTAVEEYVAEFDSEIDAYRQRLREANQEIGRLQADVRRLEAKKSTGSGILNTGKEQPYYPGEIADAVLEALRAGKNSLHPEGRRRDIVNDVLDANSESDNGAEIIEDIKAALTGERDVSERDLRALERIGFSIKGGGKHTQAIYRNDQRYVFTIPKTSSDHRASKNVASEIIRRLFK